MNEEVRSRFYAASAALLVGGAFFQPILGHSAVTATPEKAHRVSLSRGEPTMRRMYVGNRKVALRDPFIPDAMVRKAESANDKATVPASAMNVPAITQPGVIPGTPGWNDAAPTTAMANVPGGLTVPSIAGSSSIAIHTIVVGSDGSGYALATDGSGLGERIITKGSPFAGSYVKAVKKNGIELDDGMVIGLSDASVMDASGPSAQLQSTPSPQSSVDVLPAMHSATKVIHVPIPAGAAATLPPIVPPYQPTTPQPSQPCSTGNGPPIPNAPALPQCR